MYKLGEYVRIDLSIDKQQYRKNRKKNYGRIIFSHGSKYSLSFH